jgi:DNA-binding CsgD family transcriptional regulator
MGIDKVPAAVSADATVPLLDLSEVLLHAPSLAGLASAAISEVILSQFRAQVLCFNEIRLDERMATTPFLHSRRPPLGAASPRLGDMLCVHPLVTYYADTCLDEPLLVADVCSRSEWESTEIATELRHQFGVQDQITIPTAVAPAQVSAWVIMREEPFEERDRELARELGGLLRGLRSPPALPEEASSEHPVAGTTPLDTHLPTLTHRELEVVSLLGEGLTAYGIGRRLAIAPSTVDKHLQRVYHKLDVHDRLAAVLVASRHRLIPPAADVAPEGRRPSK